MYLCLHREVIEKKPEEFKIACLQQIRSLFPEDCNPFYAGFGNKHTVSLQWSVVCNVIAHIVCV